MRRRPFAGGLGLAIALLVLGCGGAAPPLVPAPGGGVVIASDDALAFQRRIEGFYLRLAHRRFNTLETFNDFILRDHFLTPDLFFDYYADLADHFELWDFEKSRPYEIEILDFLFESDRRALVQVRFVGWDDRPLQIGSTEFTQVDGWEWADGTWWLRPGKL